jgi:acyl-CoA synthetase (NDP forming)
VQAVDGFTLLQDIKHHYPVVKLGIFILDRRRPFTAHQTSDDVRACGPPILTRFTGHLVFLSHLGYLYRRCGYPFSIVFQEWGIPDAACTQPLLAGQPAVDLKPPGEIVMRKTTHEKLDPIFRPSSVAVIGASNTPRRWGYDIMNSILKHSRFRGEVYPVNPRDDIVHGLKAHKAVTDIPGHVDLAVIVVNAGQTVEVFRQCVEKGVGGAVIITAGFAEIGPDGARLQKELADLSDESGIPFVGPNCMGIWTSAVGLNLCFYKPVRPGPIAFISQSGTMGDYLFDMSQAKKYGFAKFISSGNQASLDVSDYLEYMAGDADTQVVALYLEGVKNGRRFIQAAQKVTKTKPVLAYKIGQTEEGARAAATHTASLTGSSEIFAAACKQAGVVLCDNMLEMFDFAEALGHQPLPPGNRVGVASGGGGFCVVSAEACAKAGLQVPVLDESTQAEIRQQMRAFAPNPTNPVDMIAIKGHLAYATVIDIIARQDYIDGLIIMPPYGRFSRKFSTRDMKELVDCCAMIAAIPRKYRKPVIVFSMRNYSETAMYEIMKAGDIPFFESPETCAKAMKALVVAGQYQRSHGG